jgi:hypothetical protein
MAKIATSLTWIEEELHASNGKFPSWPATIWAPLLFVLMAGKLASVPTGVI